MPDDDSLLAQGTVEFRQAERDHANAAPGHRSPRSNSDAARWISSAAVGEAIAEEKCNGCYRPRREWGPVCPGMTQGDWTHFHSPEWWRSHEVAS